MNKNDKITQKYLKELLEYNPDTGDFIRLKNVNNVKKGSVAGSIDRKPACPSYLVIGINKERYPSHRLAWLYMTGHWPKNQIDHIDGNGLNNRFNNLRDATPCENSRNCKLASTNTSGYVGVRWHKRAKKWIANIMDRGKLIHLGYFLNIEQAIIAREKANIKYGYHQNHGQIRQ